MFNKVFGWVDLGCQDFGWQDFSWLETVLEKGRPDVEGGATAEAGPYSPHHERPRP